MAEETDDQLAGVGVGDGGSDGSPALNPPPSRRPWWGRGLRWKAPLLLITGAVVVLGIASWQASCEVEARLAVIRDAGHPTNAIELDAWYEMPEGRNAADVYMQAFDAYVPPHSDDPQMSQPPPDVTMGEVISTEKLAAMHAWLQANEKTLLRLHEAGQIEHARYSVDLTRPFELSSISHFGRLRSAARLLRAEALAAAAMGDGDKTAAALEAMVAVGRSTRDDPRVTPFLVGMSINALAFDTAETVLERIGLTDEQLARLDAAFRPTLDPRPRERALIGERANVLGMFEHPSSYSKPGQAIGRNLRFLSLNQFDRRKALDQMDYLISIQSERRSLPADSHEPVVLRYYHPVARTLLPIFPPQESFEWVLNANVHSLLVLLAARRFELATGRLPASLDELAPKYIAETPFDPLSLQDRRLQMTVTERSIAVYSVGRDGIDNHGHRHGANQPGTDIVMQLPSLGHLLPSRDSDGR